MRLRPLLYAALSVAVFGCSDDSNSNNVRANNANNTNNVNNVEDMQRSDMGDDMANSNCGFTPGADESFADPQIYTPKWAFLPWISKDISDGADTREFVQGFIDRDIPIGVVVLDSPWETAYNTFVPNEQRYPEFATMVSDLRAQNVRIVLWTTQMVNTLNFDLETGGGDTAIYPNPSPNYETGSECGYYINEGDEFTWWKGKGSAVDFWNPDGMQWWHRQQDALLEMGVAGWKLDFGEEYITTDSVQTFDGEKTFQEYSEKYYQDFYAYGADKVGTDEFVTMVRAYDQSYQFDGRFYARPEHAPVVWAGDNHRDWVGLADALDHIFRSAEAGYVVLGSDLGGYLDRDENEISRMIPFDQDNFVRWTAVSGMMPFMQLHGRDNLAPWTVETNAQETVDIYRYWATLHTELIPFWFSLAQEAYAGNAPPIIRPQGQEADWTDDYRYMLGEAFLVAPVLDETGTRDVELPAGTWFDWWDQTTEIAGDQTLQNYDATDQSVMPLFVKEGAIIPMDLLGDTSGISAFDSKGALAILAYPGGATTAFSLHGESDTVDSVSLRTSEVVLSSAPRGVVFRIHTRGRTLTSVTLNGSAMTNANSATDLESADSGWWVDAEGTFLWVKVPATTDEVSVGWSE